MRKIVYEHGKQNIEELAPAEVRYDRELTNECDVMGRQYRFTQWTQRRSIDFHLVEECDFKRDGPMKLSEIDGKGNAYF